MKKFAKGRFLTTELINRGLNAATHLPHGQAARVEKLEKITPPEEVLLLARTQRKPKEFGRGRGALPIQKELKHIGVYWLFHGLPVYHVLLKQSGKNPTC